MNQPLHKEVPLRHTINASCGVRMVTMHVYRKERSFDNLQDNQNKSLDNQMKVIITVCFQGNRSICVYVAEMA